MPVVRFLPGAWSRMQVPTIRYVLGAALFVAGLVVAFLKQRTGQQGRLRLVAPNLWALHHLCRTAGTMLRSTSAIDHVEIDLTNIARLDGSGLVSLDYACRRWTDAGARVIIAVGSADVAEAIRQRGFRADLRHGSGDASADPTILH